MELGGRFDDDVGDDLAVKLVGFLIGLWKGGDLDEGRVGGYMRIIGLRV